MVRLVGHEAIGAHASATVGHSPQEIIDVLALLMKATIAVQLVPQLALLALGVFVRSFAHQAEHVVIIFLVSERAD